MLTFQKAAKEHVPIIHKWLDAPHVKAVWDEQTKDHPEGGLTRRELAAFVTGKPAIFTPWVVFLNNTAFALILEERDKSLVKDCRPFLVREGLTASLDFFIGEESFLGKGLSYRTLAAFISQMPPEVKRVLIDPSPENTKAIHVYKKAGFRPVREFVVSEGLFKENTLIMMQLDR